MDEKRALIALSQIKGLSRLAKRRICDAYPDVDRLLHPDAGGALRGLEGDRQGLAPP